jgi:hypothetical protein
MIRKISEIRIHLTIVNRIFDRYNWHIEYKFMNMVHQVVIHF